jgi:hypothetical protein
MTPPSSLDTYDENSVFNRLFAENKKPRKPTQAERMAKIFAQAPREPETIDVADFLPSYKA